MARYENSGNLSAATTVKEGTVEIGAVTLTGGSAAATLVLHDATGATNQAYPTIKAGMKTTVQTELPGGLTRRTGLSAYPTGARARELGIDDAEAVLTSGGASFVLSQDFTVSRIFRFDVDLDVQRFDMFVDSNLVVSDMPLLDTTFDVPSDLRFETGQCILECFPAEYTVDDVRVTKTD